MRHPVSLVRAAWLLPVVLCSMALPAAVTADDAGAPPAATAPHLTNKMCPLQPDETVDPTMHVEYKGQTIYFCCHRCRNKFLRNPSAYEAAVAAVMPASAKAAAEKSAAKPVVQRPPPAPFPRFLRWLGKLHPVVVHFPIALILAAAFAEFLIMRGGAPWLAGATRYCVLLGALSAAVSAALGWAAWYFATFESEVAWIVNWHRWLGTATAGTMIIAALLSERSHLPGGRRWRLSYRVALFSSAILVGVTGHFGGTIVFGVGHYRW